MHNTYNNTPAIVATVEGVQVMRQYRNQIDPLHSAQWFSIVLSTEKGYSNTIVPILNGFRVVCDETQKAVEFLRS